MQGQGNHLAVVGIAMGETMQCTECFRDRHRFLPFHRIEHWAREYFEPAWMCQVGVEIHLGHGGQPCPSRNHRGPTEHGSEEDDDDSWEDESESIVETDEVIPVLAGPDACVVVDKSGVHRILIRPCQCPGCPSLDLQFLDMGLFPASLKKIQTAFTFSVLDDFRMDNLECKTAGLNYYNKLRRLTSNTFPKGVPACVNFLACGKTFNDPIFITTG